MLLTTTTHTEQHMVSLCCGSTEVPPTEERSNGQWCVTKPISTVDCGTFLVHPLLHLLQSAPVHRMTQPTLLVDAHRAGVLGRHGGAGDVA